VRFFFPLFMLLVALLFNIRTAFSFRSFYSFSDLIERLHLPSPDFLPPSEKLRPPSFSILLFIALKFSYIVEVGSDCFTDRHSALSFPFVTFFPFRSLPLNFLPGPRDVLIPCAKQLFLSPLVREGSLLVYEFFLFSPLAYPKFFVA